jgi:hypothetical protein
VDGLPSQNNQKPCNAAPNHNPCENENDSGVQVLPVREFQGGRLTRLIVAVAALGERQVLGRGRQGRIS